MKAIRPGRSFAILPVNLCLEDIQEIMELLRKVDANVTIATRRAEYESLDELRTHEGVRLKAFTLSIPSVILEFNRKREMEDKQPANRLQSRSSTDDRVEQCFLQIRERLLNRRTWFARVFSLPLLGIFVLAFFVYLIANSEGGRIAIPLRTGLLTIALPLVVIVLWVVQLSSGYRLELVNRTEQTSWWSQHGSQLLIAVLSALIGAVVTVLFCK